MLNLHLNYIAGYTGPLLFLFERTHTYHVEDQGLLPWWFCCLGESLECKTKSNGIKKLLFKVAFQIFR